METKKKNLWQWISRCLMLLFRIGRAMENSPKQRQGGNAALGLMKSSMQTSTHGVGATASVTFGPSCSAPLPRSRVLSLLQWDCRHSARKIEWLVLHCTDTRPDQDFTIEKLAACHRRRGFGDWPGYHLYVRRDGTLYYCRPVSRAGCHVKGWNQTSIGICYEGGHNRGSESWSGMANRAEVEKMQAECGINGLIPLPSKREGRGGGSRYESPYEDNRTAEQLVVLDEVFRALLECYPEAKIRGHCDFPGVAKACPCLSPPTAQQYGYLKGGRWNDGSITR